LLGQTVGEFSDVIDGGGVWDESADGVPAGEPGGGGGGREEAGRLGGGRGEQLLVGGGLLLLLAVQRRDPLHRGRRDVREIVLLHRRYRVRVHPKRERHNPRSHQQVRRSERLSRSL